MVTHAHSIRILEQKEPVKRTVYFKVGLSGFVESVELEWVLILCWNPRIHRVNRTNMELWKRKPLFYYLGLKYRATMLLVLNKCHKAKRGNVVRAADLFTIHNPLSFYKIAYHYSSYSIHLCMLWLLGQLASHPTSNSPESLQANVIPRQKVQHVYCRYQFNKKQITNTLFEFCMQAECDLNSDTTSSEREARNDMNYIINFLSSARSSHRQMNVEREIYIYAKIILFRIILILIARF